MAGEARAIAEVIGGRSPELFTSEDPDDPKFTGKVQSKSVLIDGFKIAGVKLELGFIGSWWREG